MKPLIKGALIAMLPLVLSCASCKSKSVSHPAKSLSSAYSTYFDIGAAVTAGEWGFDSLTHYPASLLAEFSSLTAENCMKPDALQKTKGSFTWSFGQRLVDYAKENNKRLRGHTLVWHNQTPDWMAKNASSKEEARENMKVHIETILKKWDEKDIYCWDVVNEAINDGAAEVYRNDSPWFKVYGGPEFIRDAFIFARSANPKVKLLYNDYNVVNQPKRNHIVTMIKELKLIEDGLIDGVGIQAHWNLDWPSISTIDQTIKTFAAMGLTVHITELDIKTKENQQGLLEKRYREIFEVFRANADHIESVTFWGVADDHTWLTDFTKYVNFPFLFDVEGKPKSSYFIVRDFAQNHEGK